MSTCSGGPSTVANLGPRWTGLWWEERVGRALAGATWDWIRSILRQCDDAGVPCFVKQLGARSYQQVHVEDTRGFRPDGGVDPDYRFTPSQRGWFSSLGYSLEVLSDGVTRLIEPYHLIDRKGGNDAEWPTDLRVRQYPAKTHGVSGPDCAGLAAVGEGSS